MKAIIFLLGLVLWRAASAGIFKIFQSGKAPNMGME